MIYIILILLTLHLAFYKPSNALSCGLFGWLGDDGNKINREAITILGMFNGERGGDASGLLSNSGYSKSITHTTYSKFLRNNIDYNSFIENDTTFLLGHMRKSSPGTNRTDKAAQPVALTKHDKSITYGLIHNGVIRNANELFKITNKKLKESNLSDSYDIANILFAAKENIPKIKKVLESYNGKAALVWTSPLNERRAYLFRGVSKATKHYANVSDERPLYILKRENGSLYFSSIKESLETAFNDMDDDVEELESNTLYEVYNGRIEEQYAIDRSNSFQDNISYDNSYSSFEGNQYSPSYYNASSVKTLELGELTYLAKSKSYISLINGLYCSEDKPLDGYIVTTSFGRLLSKIDITNNTTLEYYMLYFIHGYLIKKVEIENVKRRRGEFERDLFSLKADGALYTIKRELSRYTYMPVISPLPNSSLKVTTAQKGNSYYTDSNFKYPFTEISCMFSNGDLKKVYNNYYSIISDSSRNIFSRVIQKHEIKELIKEGRISIFENSKKIHTNNINFKIIEKRIEKEIVENQKILDTLFSTVKESFIEIRENTAMVNLELVEIIESLSFNQIMLDEASKEYAKISPKYSKKLEFFKKKNIMYLNKFNNSFNNLKKLTPNEED